MKQSIYYGNVTSHVVSQPALRPFSEVSNDTIDFTGFDLTSSTTSTKKLDLLFYNRVNEIGEVLSSLVYISEPLSVNDVSVKHYDIKKLYVNTDAELAMGIKISKTDFTYLNCKWFTSKFFTSSISPLVDTRHDELAENSIPSVMIDKYGVSFDGWYTQMSVGVKALTLETPATAPICKNLLGYHTFAETGTALSILLTNLPASPYDDDNWSPYTVALESGTVNPDGSILVQGVSLAKVLSTLSVDNPYIKQDLFILPNYISLYDTFVVQYAEYPTYGNMYPVLRNKHRIIHDYALKNNFVEAQYVLQTTEFFRATIH